MHEQHQLVAGPRGAIHGRDPALDVARRDRLDGRRRERRQEVRVDRRAVAVDGRRLAAAVVLDVAQVLRGGVGERRTGAQHPGQCAAARLVEHVAQPGLGSPLGQVAMRRPAALGPRRPDLALDLAAVGEAVLRVPDRPAVAVHRENMARRRPSRHEHGRMVRRSGDILGTRSANAPGRRNRKALAMQGFR